MARKHETTREVKFAFHDGRIVWQDTPIYDELAEKWGVSVSAMEDVVPSVVEWQRHRMPTELQPVIEMP